MAKYGQGQEIIIVCAEGKCVYNGGSVCRRDVPPYINEDLICETFTEERRGRRPHTLRTRESDRQK
jgi:hypothetical protein